MKKVIAALLLMAMTVGLLAGCEPAPAPAKELATVYPVGYQIQDDADNEYYFMNREYALTAADIVTRQEELDRAAAYLQENILNSVETGKTAYDFRIGDEKFSDVVKSWESTVEQTGETDDAILFTVTYKKADQPLTVRVEATQYKAYAVIEWTVWIENTGNADSAQLTDFYGIRDTFGTESTDPDDKYQLTVFNGGQDEPTSFHPETLALYDGQTKARQNMGGRSTAGSAPYINVEWQNSRAKWGKEGVFISLGWTGQWELVCANDKDGLFVEGRQLRFNTYLKPGEKVRSPLLTLLFWDQDFMRSQNLWRQWMYTVAMIQKGGEPLKIHCSGSTGVMDNLSVTSTEDRYITFMSKFEELGYDIDSWQMDAGWYNLAIPGEWSATGDWNVDTSRFPSGSLGRVGEAAKAHGAGYILWYEPERFITDSTWYNEFKGTDWMIENIGTTHLLNLSNEEVLEYLIGFLTGSLEENNVTIYRQDCNVVNPAMYASWNLHDEEDRQGLTENRYVVNLLRLYDAIIDYLGEDGFIDNCASGGKRMDLEVMKRTVTLWRDDACYEPRTTQCHSWNYNFLFPYTGQGTIEKIPSRITYAFRSNMMTSMNFVWDMDTAVLDVRLKNKYDQCYEEFRAYAGYMTGNYFPLTPFNSDQEGWIGWQFVNYDGTDGILQIFRRYTEQESIDVYLSGLNPEAQYVVTDIDTEATITASGQELMQNGITIDTAYNNQALILTVKQA